MNKKIDDHTEKLRQEIIKTLEDSKAQDIVEIDLANKTDIAEFMIIATGTSDRHIKTLADNLSLSLKRIGQNYVVEGGGSRDWILVDSYDVIVHLFKSEARKTYNLEEMWKK